MLVFCQCLPPLVLSPDSLYRTRKTIQPRVKKGNNGQIDGIDVVGLRHVQVMNISYVFQGPWAVSFSLPRVEAPVPTRTPQPATCLTSERWHALKAEAPVVPAPESGGRLLVEGPVQAGMTFPTLYVMSLGGTQKTVIGPGAWASLSPDGKRIVFSEMIFGQSAYGLYVANLDGTEKRLVAGGAGLFAAGAVWSPDGELILISGSEQTPGSTLEGWNGFVVQPETCEVHRLPVVEGEVKGWR
jgi:hypothetical protein